MGSFMSSAFRRYRTRAAVAIDSDISENSLGNMNLLVAGAAPHPALDLHGDRCGSDSNDCAVTRHFVANEHRAMKAHGGNGDGRRAASRPACCHLAACEIHL